MDTLEEHIEQEGYSLGIQRYDNDPTGGLATHGKNIYKQFVLELCDSIRAWLESSAPCGRGAGTKEFFRKTYEYHHALCAVAVRRVWRGAHNGNQVSSICNSCGTEVIQEYVFQELRLKSATLGSSLSDRFKGAQVWEIAKILKDRAEKAHIEVPREATSIGMVFVQLMLDSGLFEQENRREGGRNTLSFLRFTEEATRLMNEKREVLRLLTPVYPPMVEKPLPWETVIGGGYKHALRDRLTLLREGRVPVEYLDQIHEQRASYAHVFKAINAIQETPYRINKKILEIVEWVELVGKQRSCGLPMGEPLPDPEYPPEDSPRQVFARWRLDKANIRESNLAMESKRRLFLGQLSAARQWKDYPALYFPCTLDWRWRVYPVGTAINPQSDSVGKAFLEFLEGKPLVNPESIEHFKVCGAGLFGFDKAPIEDRVAWVDERAQEILLCADKPKENLWWQDADEPLRFLAWCFAYADWVDGRPLHFICAVDGSQNGIQHYALLSRCPETAKRVNVSDNPTPQDLYSEVKEWVRVSLEREVEESPIKGTEENIEAAFRSIKNFRGDLLGDEKPVPPDLEALYMSHMDHLCRLKALRELDRTLCKRPVMTFSYSVTNYGITEQLLDELRTRDLNRELKFDKHWIKGVSFILTNKILDGIHAQVSSASRVMKWFHSMVDKACDEKGRVMWRSPLGIPIVQRYTQTDSMRIRMTNSMIRLSCSTKVATRTPDVRKARAGIAPNIIHSFDAAHLQQTILRGLEAGLDTFYTVHDSYGTHAEDMATLSRCLRQAAVDIYSVNQLERLRLELGGTTPYPLGSFPVDEVHKARYFFC